MVKYYRHCPTCRKRMRRTGNKVKVGETLEGYPLYEREYECRNPECLETTWLYNERTNYWVSGIITIGKKPPRIPLPKGVSEEIEKRRPK